LGAVYLFTINQKLVSHMSYVICHMSYVICYMLYVICYMWEDLEEFGSPVCK
jgi:hypothetical protein